MARLFSAYDRLLNTNPIATKTITSVVLFTLGDVMAQSLEGKKLSELDLPRLARQAAWGALFTPLAHAWYLNLDKWIPGKGAAVVVKKTAADQVRRARARILAISRGHLFPALRGRSMHV